MSDKKLNSYWNKVEDRLPPEGTLCMVYTPYGVNRQTGQTVGPIAFVYRRSEGWVMADQPRKLTFPPFYWQEVSQELFRDERQ